LKALLKTKKGKGFLEIKEMPVPEINYDEVLIKVHYTGICGTDVHIFTDQFPIYYPPVILGHEFSGEIVELGEKVTSWKTGERVVAECQSLACGKCRFCRTGHPEACTAKRSPGWGINGSFADYIKMPAWLLHKIPDSVSYRKAALTEPAAVSSQALYSRAKVSTGDFVVVLGTGPIGIIIAKMAKIAGASQVLITGIDKDEKYRLLLAQKLGLLLAQKLGIENTVNVSKVNLKEMVDDLTDGIGADLVVEATGVEPAINQAFDIVRKLGKITVVGIPGQNKSNIKWLTGSFKALDVSFSLFENRALDLTDLVTHEFKLADWKMAFDKAIDCQGGKVLFKI